MTKYDQWKTAETDDPHFDQWFDENVDDLENIVEFVGKSELEYHDFLIQKYEKTFG